MKIKSSILKDEQGKICTNDKEKVKICERYLDKLYGDDVLKEEIGNLEVDELEEVKDNNADGLTKTPAGLIKYAG